MFRLAFDFIITWRETRTRPNAYLFTQTGYRARGKISRKVEAEFSIYDVSRSEENAHGAKIEDWIVHYSAPIEDNQEVYNNTQPEKSDEHEN